MTATHDRTTEKLTAPFPYYGGKGRIADLVWSALGDPSLYVEPFIGSAAVLLARPLPIDFPGNRVEIINDADAFVANLWRSIQSNPRAVAQRIDHPLSEIDILARHRRLCDHRAKRCMVDRVGLNAEYFDARRAGDWLYCKSGWIGGGLCDGEWFGPGDPRNHGTGINGPKIPQLNTNGIFSRGRRLRLESIIDRLARRLRHVSICCGNWNRVFFPSQVEKGTVGVFLDPPYGYATGRCEKLYRVEKVENADVAAFCRRLGRQRNLRIVLAGLDGEYDLPGWRVIPWSAGHCFSKPVNSEDRHKERLWLSPHCLPVTVPIPVATGRAKPSRWRSRHERQPVARRSPTLRPSKKAR